MAGQMQAPMAPAPRMELQLNPPYRVRGPGGLMLLVAQRTVPKRRRNHPYLSRRPKRPINAYGAFLKDFFQRRRLGRDFPMGTGPRDHIRIAALEWRNLAVAQRQVYVQACAQGRARYHRQMQLWKQHRKFLNRPPSSYALFFKDKFEAERARFPNGTRITHVARRIAALWAVLPAQEKIPYQEQYHASRLAYDQKLQDFRNGVRIPELERVMVPVAQPPVNDPRNAPERQMPAPQPRILAPMQRAPAPQPRMAGPQLQMPAPRQQVPGPQPQMAVPQPRILAPQLQMPVPQQRMAVPQPRMPAPQQQMAIPQPRQPIPQPRMPAPQQLLGRSIMEQMLPPQPRMPVPQQVPAAPAVIQENNPIDGDEDMDVENN